MPLIIFDMIEGRTEQEVVSLLDASHEAVVKAFEVPERDRYQVVHQHKPYEMSILDTGLGMVRSNKFVLISIISNKRTFEKKETLYELLVKNIEDKCGIPSSDIMINITENSDEDWSFGNGLAQFMTGDL